MTDTKPPRLNPEAQKAHDEAKAKYQAGNVVTYTPGQVLYTSERCGGMVRWSAAGRLQQQWVIEHYGSIGLEKITEEWRDVPTEEMARDIHKQVFDPNP